MIQRFSRNTWVDPPPTARPGLHFQKSFSPENGAHDFCSPALLVSRICSSSEVSRVLTVPPALRGGILFSARIPQQSPGRKQQQHGGAEASPLPVAGASPRDAPPACGAPAPREGPVLWRGCKAVSAVAVLLTRRDHLSIISEHSLNIPDLIQVGLSSMQAHGSSGVTTTAPCKPVRSSCSEATNWHCIAHLSFPSKAVRGRVTRLARTGTKFSPVSIHVTRSRAIVVSSE